MKGRVVTLVALAVLVVFLAGMAQAADSISAYMGFSREVNEALAKRIQEKTGIEVKNITLSWGEIWARLKSEAPRFNADMVMSFGGAGAIEGTQKEYYEAYQSPAWKDIAAAFKSPKGTYYALGTLSFLLAMEPLLSRGRRATPDG